MRSLLTCECQGLCQVPISTEILFHSLSLEHRSNLCRRHTSSKDGYRLAKRVLDKSIFHPSIGWRRHVQSKLHDPWWIPAETVKHTKQGLFGPVWLQPRQSRFGFCFDLAQPHTKTAMADNSARVIGPSGSIHPIDPTTMATSNDECNLPASEVLCHVVDVHCHPTDSPIPRKSMEDLPITICAMSTRPSDQVRVSELAETHPDKVIPCFGQHLGFISSLLLISLSGPIRLPSMVHALDFPWTRNL
jgi:hypothetical protein